MRTLKDVGWGEGTEADAAGSVEPRVETQAQEGLAGPSRRRVWAEGRGLEAWATRMETRALREEGH